MEFVRDAYLERQLEARGIKFTYVEDFDLASVDRDEAGLGNVRLSGLNTGQLCSLRSGIDRGDPMTPIVVIAASNGTGKHRLAGGYHRLFVYDEREIGSSAAYVLHEMDAATVALVMRMLNTWNGLPTSQEERVEQALSYIAAFAATASDVARELGIPYGILKDRMLERQTRILLSEKGVERAGDLLSSAVLEVARLRRPKIMVEAAKLILDARLGGQTRRNIISRVAEAESDDLALERLAEARTELAADIEASLKGRIKPPYSPLRRLPAVLGQLNKISNVADKSLEAISIQEKKRLIAELRRMAQKLGELADRLEVA